MTRWLFGMKLIEGAEGPRFQGSTLGWVDQPVFVRPRRRHTGPIDGYLVDIGDVRVDGGVGEIGRIFLDLDDAARVVARFWEGLTDDQRRRINDGSLFAEILHSALTTPIRDL